MSEAKPSGVTIYRFMYEEKVRKLRATGTQPVSPTIVVQEGGLSGESRHPRQFFTNALTNLFQRLDTCAEKDVTWKAPFPWFEPNKGTERIAVKNVWVAGSYLRGAPTCGDLDLIVEVDPVRHAATAGNLRNAFFRGLKDVRPFFGTPEDNTSGIVMPDARLIWQPGMNWRDALAGIKENPNAGRFSRLTDRLPFRMEQLSIDLYRAEGIIAALDQGLIRWEFFPLDTIDSATVDPEIHEILASVKERSLRSKKAEPFFDLLACLLHERYGVSNNDLQDLLLRENGRPAAGISLEIGSSRVPVETLDDYNVERLVICPYQTARGPNGIWVIERGDCHPLVAAAAKRQVFAVFCNGHPDFFHFGSWHSQRGIELWSTPAQAAEWRDDLAHGYAEELGEDELDEVEENREVVELTGRSLLSVLSKVALVDLDEDSKVLSRVGMGAVDHPDTDHPEIVPVDDLLNGLPAIPVTHVQPSS